MRYFIAMCVIVGIMLLTGRHETALEQGVIKLAVSAYAVRILYKAAQNKDIVVAFLSNMCFIIPEDDDYGHKQPEKVK